MWLINKCVLTATSFSYLTDLTKGGQGLNWTNGEAALAKQMLEIQICPDEPNLTLLDPACWFSHFRVSDQKKNDTVKYYRYKKLRSKMNSL